MKVIFLLSCEIKEETMIIYRINEEISLKAFGEGDAEEFYYLIIHSKDYLKEWLGWLDSINSPNDTLRNIQAKQKEAAENGGYPISFAIVYKGAIVGTIGFNTISKMNKIGSIGYWLGEEYQGRGIMTLAFEFIIDYGFKRLALNKIEVRIAEKNDKSRSLPKHFGFAEEGRLRQVEWLYDHFTDHIVYGLLAEEWIR